MAEASNNTQFLRSKPKSCIDVTTASSNICESGGGIRPGWPQHVVEALPDLMIRRALLSMSHSSSPSGRQQGATRRY